MSNALISGQKSWTATIGTAIALQWGIVLSLALVAWLVSGVAAQSLFWGGASVALPNSVLALWLTLRVLKAGSAGAGAMMGGEIAKLGCTLIMLVAVIVRLKPELSWPALLIGVVVALKAQWLALWFTRQY